MGNPTENTLGPSVFTMLCEAHGAMREQDDRRYHYSVTCLLPQGANADLPGDEITLILRELDTVDPEEYTLTVADLRAATPVGENAWRIPALDWVLVFYRHVPIAHSTLDGTTV